MLKMKEMIRHGSCSQAQITVQGLSYLRWDSLGEWPISAGQSVIHVSSDLWYLESPTSPSAPLLTPYMTRHGCEILVKYFYFAI